MSGNGNWVEDFDSFQNSDENPARLAISSVNSKKPLSRKEKIESELKLLEWHKLANDAALKAALLQTKNLKEIVPEKNPSHTTEDARWMRKVVETEHVKPLHVSKDYVLEFEKTEKANAERLTNQVERHINTLKKLREKLEERQDVKSRSQEYRSWRHDFSAKKNAVMLGKTLAEVESKGKQSDEYEEDPEQPTTGKGMNRGGGGSQELSTVLDSLSKLAELEKRISSLEKDNVYEQMMDKERPIVDKRTTFEFKPQRLPPEDVGGGGVKLGYAVRSKQSTWEVGMPPLVKKPVGTGAIAAAARRKVQEQFQKRNMRGGGGDGVFLTGLDNDDAQMEDEDEEMCARDAVDVETQRETLRRERLRQQELAPAGQKNLRSRIQTKKQRAKEDSLGAKRHDDAMKEIAKRRLEQVSMGKKKKVGGPPAVQFPGKGASAGIKTKNKHLAEFEQVKLGHKRRKDDIGKTGSGGPVGAGQQLPAVRVSSHTAPQIGSKRVPNTKTSGTVTRRTDAPVRRAMGGGGGGAGEPARTAPPAISVSGVGGIKLLRGQRANR